MDGIFRIADRLRLDGILLRQISGLIGRNCVLPLHYAVVYAHPVRNCAARKKIRTDDCLELRLVTGRTGFLLHVPLWPELPDVPCRRQRVVLHRLEAWFGVSRIAAEQLAY